MYSIAHNHQLTSPYQANLLFDKEQWESFNEADLDEHFQNIKAIFKQRVDFFSQKEHTLTSEDEKELQLMLDAYMQAKLFIQSRDE